MCCELLAVVIATLIIKIGLVVLLYFIKLLIHIEFIKRHSILKCESIFNLNVGIRMYPGQVNFCETLQMLDGFGRIFQTKWTNLYSYINSNFTKCCKNSGVLMVVKCRKENSALKECLTAYYNDPAFYEECKMEYLKEREEFRKTGIPTKKRLQKLPTSM
eukprot:XP_024309135.1 COX assembly mitochondrial protein homolog isoform X3 [Homo sapiens]